jgi:hypothetical protein
MYVQSHVARWSVHKEQAASQLAMLVINVMCRVHNLNTNTIKFLFVLGRGGGGKNGSRESELSCVTTDYYYLNRAQTLTLSLL